MLTWPTEQETYMYELSGNTTEESHAIGILSIEIDKYEKSSLITVLYLVVRERRVNKTRLNDN